MFGKVWKGEEMPRDWNESYIVILPKKGDRRGVRELRRNTLDIGGREGTEQNYSSTSSDIKENVEVDRSHLKETANSFTRQTL